MSNQLALITALQRSMVSTGLTGQEAVTSQAGTNADENADANAPAAENRSNKQNSLSDTNNRADDGFQLRMLSTPKEQRTPDAQPALHASHRTIQVHARQQRSNNQNARVADGPDKKLSFLLPETPVDAAKYADAELVGASWAPLEEGVDTVAGVATSSANLTAMAAHFAHTTPGGAGKTRPNYTPGKVASTPMAIEVLSQLFNHSQQMSQTFESQMNEAQQPVLQRTMHTMRTKHDAERVEFHVAADVTDAVDVDADAEDEDYAYGDDSPAMHRAAKVTKLKPRRKHNKPRSTVKEKAARAASLAVARPKKSAAEVGKSCNCKKSQCLKMYCDCFAASGYCHPSCTCESCKNTSRNEDVVNVARAGILMKDPTAFDEKVDEKAGAHRKGCRCKRSKCLKKYCECYQAGVACNETCQCVGCANCDGDATLLALPLAPETEKSGFDAKSMSNVQAVDQTVYVPGQVADGSTHMQVQLQMPFNASTMQAFELPIGENPAAKMHDTHHIIQDSIAPLKVLMENSNVASQQQPASQLPTQQFDPQPQDDPSHPNHLNYPHPSHVQSQTPVTDNEGASPTLPIDPAGAAILGSKARRMTSSGAKSSKNVPDWRQFSTSKTPSENDKENKRPRRAASSGVAAAAAAAKHGVSHDRVGFEQKWDTITPPCRVRRKRKDKTAEALASINGMLNHASTDVAGTNTSKDIFAPFSNAAGLVRLPGTLNINAKNYPKKAEARMELMKALEKEQAQKNKEEEADAATVLFSLAQ